jgi:hypothetical protein
MRKYLDVKRNAFIIGLVFCGAVFAQDYAQQQFVVVQAQQVSHATPVVPDFTGSERWGTFGLNYLLPGLGSFVIMKDNVGGFVQVGLVVTGYVLVFSGIMQLAQTSVGETYVDEENISEALGLYLAGGLTLALNFVFNIVRSSKYTKPASRQFASINLGVLPSRDGNIQPHLTYSLKF